MAAGMLSALAARSISDFWARKGEGQIRGGTELLAADWHLGLCEFAGALPPPAAPRIARRLSVLR